MIRTMFGLALMMTVFSSVYLSNPAPVYQATYTDPGKCLHGTPFDPVRGAVVHEYVAGKVPIFIVIPRAANTYKPSVLLFAVHREPFSSSLTPADNVTEDALYKWCA